MYILNTTFVLDHSLTDVFVSWLKEVYLPAAMATGIFGNSRVAKILQDQDPLTVNIACELSCESLSEAARWHDETASLLRDDIASRWGERVLNFSTYLKTL